MATHAVMSTATEPHRGLKRPAAEALEAEQRLSKRFNLLNIGMPPRCPQSTCSWPLTRCSRQFRQALHPRRRIVVHRRLGTASRSKLLPHRRS